ncbi:MAG: hypothetical protein KIT11_07110 [Fimbriimonadaceae bacterium]|nr:hypothetical protein [Fimbriimonadaceae bacterium]QYK56120.1 MAG: hypothetical protein KF733_01300 [Fimbriimonadaceae bacterium]
MIGLLAVLLTAPQDSQAAVALNPACRYMFWEDKGYAVLPPKKVGGPLVSRIAASNDRYVVFWETPLASLEKVATIDQATASKAKTRLGVWDSTTDKVSYLGADLSVPMGQLELATNGPVLLQGLPVEQEPGGRSRVRLVWLDHMTSKTLDVGPAGGSSILSPSGKFLLQMTFEQDGGNPPVQKMSLYETARGTTIPIELPKTSSFRVSGWAPNVDALVLTRPATSGSMASEFVRYDLASGTVTPVDREDLFPQPLLMLANLKRDVRTLWLQTSESKRPGERAFIDAEAEEERLLGQSWAVYLRQGSLYAAAIKVVDKALILEALAREARTEALLKAKQIGTGLIIYGLDNGEMLPDKSTFRQDLLPYLKSESILDGFVYTTQERNLSKIKEPSTFVLGYIEAGGMRAVLYADGHVKLEK